MNCNLTSNEKNLLIALENVKRASPQELAGLAGMKIETMMHAAFLLEEKGFSLVEERITETYELTSEGKKYATEGLPERKVMDALKGPLSMQELKQMFPPELAGIATGWLRRKGWAKIEDGIVVPASCASIGDDERVLAMLLDRTANIEELGKENSVVDELIKRKLVVKKEEKHRSVSITPEGTALVAKGIVVEDEVAQINTEMLRSGQWKDMKFRQYNIYTAPKAVYGAKAHPYQRLIDMMRRIFLDMGFTEIKGEIIQSSFWNFDALFQPQDHPAREMQDTFHLSSTSELPAEYKDDVCAMHEYGGGTDSTGWGGTWSEEVARKNVLRTHTTSLTIKYLADNPNPPVKAFSIDRAYRRETIDPTHTPEFEQLEGIVMDKDMSFANLLGCLKEFYFRMGFEDVRFRPGYFPYTEPSVEPEVYVEGLGWVELGGAGVFRKEVTYPLGIKYPVLAWGLGVSRLAMLKLGLKDLRLLYQSDIDWLRKSEVCRL